MWVKKYCGNSFCYKYFSRTSISQVVSVVMEALLSVSMQSDMPTQPLVSKCSFNDTFNITKVYSFFFLFKLLLRVCCWGQCVRIQHFVSHISVVIRNIQEMIIGKMHYRKKPLFTGFANNFTVC